VTPVKRPGRTAASTTIYNENGNRTRVSDPAGGTITFTYDDADRVTTMRTYDTVNGDPGATPRARRP